MSRWTPLSDTPEAAKAGLRFGAVGTHTSRTMMLSELRLLLGAAPTRASTLRDLGAVTESPTLAEPHNHPRLPARDDYAHAIVEDNVLGKDTASARRTALQRLSELYGLDPQLAIFRVLRRLWEGDAPGRPLLALLCALARDPLLRVTAKVVLPLPVGSEVSRSALCDALTSRSAGDDETSNGDAPPARFKPAILDKVARHAASSWAQAGHLEGRVRKIRRRVHPSPASAAFALWLGSVQGLAGEYLLHTLWAATLDVTPDDLFDLALRAKQRGLLRAVSGGGVRSIDVTGLDPAMESR